ncbi:hypothetical protein B0H14DRAFT_2645716 [Mycena olivaceomarginata]|nr:hypothetical protein B0H14DRAFT_2645716 [Mycena olivaceomarginata]
MAVYSSPWASPCRNWVIALRKPQQDGGNAHQQQGGHAAQQQQNDGAAHQPPPPFVVPDDDAIRAHVPPEIDENPHLKRSPPADDPPQPPPQAARGCANETRDSTPEHVLSNAQMRRWIAPTQLAKFDSSPYHRFYVVIGNGGNFAIGPDSHFPIQLEKLVDIPSANPGFAQPSCKVPVIFAIEWSPGCLALCCLLAPNGLKVFTLLRSGSNTQPAGLG